MVTSDPLDQLKGEGGCASAALQAQSLERRLESVAQMRACFPYESDPRPSNRAMGPFPWVEFSSERDSPYLRRAIWLASTVAVQYDPMFRAYCEKKMSEGTHHMDMIGHVSRRMTAVIFTVLRDGDRADLCCRMPDDPTTHFRWTPQRSGPLRPFFRYTLIHVKYKCIP